MPTKAELRRADRDMPLAVLNPYVRRIISANERHYREWLDRKEANLSAPRTAESSHAE